MDDTTTTATTTRRTIEVDEDVHEVLARTAAHQGTDLAGAVRYLLKVPAVPADAPRHDDGDPDERDDE